MEKYAARIIIKITKYFNSISPVTNYSDTLSTTQQYTMMNEILKNKNAIGLRIVLFYCVILMIVLSKDLLRIDTPDHDSRRFDK